MSEKCPRILTSTKNYVYLHRTQIISPPGGVLAETAIKKEEYFHE